MQILAMWAGLVFGCCVVGTAAAQDHAAQSASANSTATAGVPLTAAQDHERLLGLLGITALRPGVKQSGGGPDAVNYDEARANPWPRLPDPLLLSNGKAVTTAKVWTTQRRPELVELFDREVLGRVPAGVPKVRWEVLSSASSVEQTTSRAVPTLARKLVGHVDNAGYPAISVNMEMSLTLPAKAGRRLR